MYKLNLDSFLTFKTVLRRFDKQRKKTMLSLLSKMTSYFFAQPSHAMLIKPAAVKNVVVVRNNSRLGNTVFLIPFLKQLREILPEANITLVSKNEWQQDLLQDCGVDNFYFTHLKFRSAFRSLRQLLSLKKQSFDLCLMPCGSAQDAFTCAFIRSVNKVSFKHRHYQFGFTHTYPKSTLYRHAALQPLSLLAQMWSIPLCPLDHHLGLNDNELELGLSVRAAIVDKSSLCIAFFRGARGEKRLSDEQWLTIIERCNRTSAHPITWVEILGPEISQPLEGDICHCRSTDLRELSAFLHHVDGFISCDTGPLHLADSAGATCIGLYSHTDPATYGLLGSRGLTVSDIAAFDPKLVLNHIVRVKQDTTQSQTVSSFSAPIANEKDLNPLNTTTSPPIKASI